MAQRHNMSDHCVLDKLCCSLNGTQHCSARLPPLATPLLEDYCHRVLILLVSACKYMRSPWHKMSSIFVCVHKSTEFDQLKSKAASDINAHCQPLECSLKASWPWRMLPQIEVIIIDQQKVPKLTSKHRNLDSDELYFNITCCEHMWFSAERERFTCQFFYKTAVDWLDCAI